MRIFADTIIPKKNPNPPDPIYKAEYPREEGKRVNNRWTPGWRDTVQGWFKQMGGWDTYHTDDASGSNRGFPDLFAVHSTIGRRVWAEFKTETGEVTDDQKRWLVTLARSGEEVYLWRPSDTNEIQAVLQQANDDAFSLRERGFVPTRGS